MKIKRTFRLDPNLVEFLEYASLTGDRTATSILEQALQEHLAGLGYDLSAPVTPRFAQVKAGDPPSPFDGRTGEVVRVRNGFVHVMFEGERKVNLFPSDRLTFLDG